MTAAAQCLTMTVTTVNIATGNTARSAAPIAKSATPQSVWAVLTSAPLVMSRSAATAPQNAKIANKRSVRIV
jgi:hypothetical protein